MIQDHFYIITGGPGVGKTALIKALEKRGMMTVAETARQLIQEQQTLQGEALPWKDKLLYRDLLFYRSLESFKTMAASAPKDLPVCFDRGFPDAICYARLIRSTISAEMETYARTWRYNPKVFILPPWKAIYQKDEQRKQDWDEAVETFECMQDTYLNYGYHLIEVPRDSIANRRDFIINQIKNK